MAVTDLRCLGTSSISGTPAVGLRTAGGTQDWFPRTPGEDNLERIRTIECYFFINTAVQNQTVLWNFAGINGVVAMDVYLQQSNILRVEYLSRIGTTVSIPATLAAPFELGTWYHLILQIDAQGASASHRVWIGRTGVKSDGSPATDDTSIDADYDLTTMTTSPSILPALQFSVPRIQSKAETGGQPLPVYQSMGHGLRVGFWSVQEPLRGGVAELRMWNEVRSTANLETTRKSFIDSGTYPTLRHCHRGNENTTVPANYDDTGANDARYTAYTGGTNYDAHPFAAPTVTLTATIGGGSTVTATTGVQYRLETTAAGSGAVGATLDVDVPLQVTVGGSSCVTPTLEVDVPLQATAAGSSSVTPTLEVDVPLQATAGGASSVTPTLEVDVPLQATAAGSGSVATTLDVDVPLQATAAGSSSVSGTLNVGQVETLTATIAGSSTVTAAPQIVIRVTVAAGGAVAPTLDVDVPLAATSAGTSSVVPTLDVDVPLTASLGGSGALAPTLEVDVPLQATIAAQAGVAATTDVRVPLQVTASGSASVSGILNVGEVVPLTATLGGAGTVSSTLEVDVPLQAAAGGTSSATGTLEVDVPLQATAAGASSVSGTLNVGQTVPLTATLGGSGAVAPTLEVDVPLSATAAGSSTVTAAPQIVMRVTVAGTSTVSGAFGTDIQLTSTASGTSSVGATLQVRAPLSATIGGSSTVSATPSVPRYRLFAQSNGAATVSVASQTIVYLSGTISATAGLATVYSVQKSADTELLEQAARDALTIGLLTEEVIYHPDGGDPVTLNAVVERNGLEGIEYDIGDENQQNSVELWIANQETIGVRDVKPGRDKVEVALVEGDPKTSMLVAYILDEDPGMYRILAVK